MQKQDRANVSSRGVGSLLLVRFNAYFTKQQLAAIFEQTFITMGPISIAMCNGSSRKRVFRYVIVMTRARDLFCVTSTIKHSTLATLPKTVAQ